MTAKKSASAKPVEPELRKLAKPVARPAAPAKAAASAVKAVAAPAPKAAAKPTASAAAKVAAKPAPKSAAKPAPAGKGKQALAKGRVPAEDDDVDIEADIAGEPEGADDPEAKTKVKPLRMKVSRAKERALMREFGLDETALTEEEVAKRRQELKTLIKMGKTRGFLTHQEINDHLPEKLVDNEILEAIVSMLNDMGIAVYEQAPDAATLLIAGGGTTTATEEEAEEAAEAALSTVDSEFGRTTDPVASTSTTCGTSRCCRSKGTRLRSSCPRRRRRRCAGRRCW